MELTLHQGPWAPAIAINEFKKQFKSKAGVDWDSRVGMVPKKGTYFLSRFRRLSDRFLRKIYVARYVCLLSSRMYFQSILLERDYADEEEDKEPKASGSKQEAEDVIIPDCTLAPEVQVWCLSLPAEM